MGSNTQYAWGEDETTPLEGVVDVLSTISTDEWEELIQCIFKKCDEYSDDETSRFYSKLLGKLLILANQ